MDHVTAPASRHARMPSIRSPMPWTRDSMDKISTPIQRLQSVHSLHLSMLVSNHSWAGYWHSSLSHQEIWEDLTLSSTISASISRRKTPRETTCLRNLAWPDRVSDSKNHRKLHECFTWMSNSFYRPASLILHASMDGLLAIASFAWWVLLQINPTMFCSLQSSATILVVFEKQTDATGNRYSGTLIIISSIRSYIHSYQSERTHLVGLPQTDRQELSPRAGRQPFQENDN